MIARFKITDDGEMQADENGEWVHVSDLPKDPARDRLWCEVYSQALASGKYHGITPARLADGAVAHYDKRVRQ